MHSPAVPAAADIPVSSDVPVVSATPAVGETRYGISMGRERCCTLTC